MKESYSNEKGNSLVVVLLKVLSYAVATLLGYFGNGVV